jgi:NADP-dependent 3-hydroxy acid dehydrogenase YdfG
MVSSLERVETATVSVYMIGGNAGMRDFQGSLAVVTGGGSGIGMSIEMDLAAHGATVIIVGRRKDPLAKVAAKVRADASVIIPHVADLTRDEDIHELKRRIQNDFGRVDILVHCAGTSSLGNVDQASVNDLDAQYKSNVRAPYVLTQALLPMLRLAHGQIVFMNSSVGLKARGGIAQYAATKHALRAIADGIRDEVNADGVRVASFYLGRTASPMQKSIHEFEGVKYRPDQLLQPGDVATVVINTLQLPRTAEVTDVSIRPMKKT